MWDLVSHIRDRIHVPYIDRQIPNHPNHWTTKEVPSVLFCLCICLAAGTEVSPERITLLHFPITFNLGNQQEVKVP